MALVTWTRINRSGFHWVVVTPSVPGGQRQGRELYPHPGVRGGGGDVVFAPLVRAVDAGVAGRGQLTGPRGFPAP